MLTDEKTSGPWLFKTKTLFISVLLKFQLSNICQYLEKNIETRGPMALNRSPEYTGQSQTFNFEI